MGPAPLDGHAFDGHAFDAFLDTVDLAALEDAALEAAAVQAAAVKAAVAEKEKEPASAYIANDPRAQERAREAQALVQASLEAEKRGERVKLV